MDDKIELVENLFPVDGELLMILPRASAAIRNTDFHRPALYQDDGRYYLAMTLESDPGEESEIAITRRMWLDELNDTEWQHLQESCKKLNLNECREKGINKTLESISDGRIQRLLVALLTFLNPRQIAILLYLYREAATQDDGSLVTFRSNDLLEAFGYKRAADKRVLKENNETSFPASIRSQLHRDLVSMHRIELTFAKSLKQGGKRGAEVEIKNVLHIEKYKIDNLPRDFDLIQAADYSYSLADEYTIRLGFFEGLSSSNNFVLFPRNLDITQKQGINPDRDYRLKLLLYLSGRLKWDKLTEGEYLHISKVYLMKNLGLFGTNKSRQENILWNTVEQLKIESYILEAQEMPGKGTAAKIQFRLNLDKIRSW